MMTEKRMMSEAEWKDFSQEAAFAKSELEENSHLTMRVECKAILAAFAELKERREAGYGAERAVAERIRQKSVEGWTPEHDAKHDQGELAIAAACYALNKMPTYSYRWWDEVREWWPWHPDWDKREKHDRGRSLEIAAALIMAELDRIAEARKKNPVGGYLREGKR